MLDQKKERYIHKIIDLYLNLPETPNRCCASDIQLASEWYQQRIKLRDVEAAMLLATGRRLFRRNADETALGPIRSLHYFRPVIQEIIKEPLPAVYLQYLRTKINEAVKAISKQKVDTRHCVTNSTRRA